MCHQYVNKREFSYMIDIKTKYRLYNDMNEHVD